MNKKTFNERINYMLNALSELKFFLERHAGTKDADKAYFYAAEKKAEEVVECAITINQDILADVFSEIGKSYYESFTDLKKLDIFSEAELVKLSNTASFRNRLAHEYMDLDPEITYKSMQAILKLYPEYLKKIMEWLKSA